MVKPTQQDVNYMLEGPFHLLEVKQQAYDAYQGYIEAVRDYWLARAELGREVGARLPVLAARAATTLLARNQPVSAQAEPASATPVAPHSPTGYVPVHTLNGWTLPYHLREGVKEFHLVAEPLEHEFAPGCVAKYWGYNGSAPGPTIEAVEGDRVRILVTEVVSVRRLRCTGTACICPVVWTGSAVCHSRISSPGKPMPMSSRSHSTARTCTTPMPTRWCSWV